MPTNVKQMLEIGEFLLLTQSGHRSGPSDNRERRDSRSKNVIFFSCPMLVLGTRSSHEATGIHHT